MKKNVAVVLGTTKNSPFAIANVILGLERHSPRFVDNYYVYHDGLSEKDKLALSKIADNIKMIEYTQDFFLERSSLSDLNTTALKRYTHMSFCRYEMFSFLSSYRHAIWIDFDILVQKDISGIIEFSPVAMLPAATPIDKALGTTPADCSPNLKCLSSGVIAVSDELFNYESVTDELYRETGRYCNTATLPDQAIINYVLNKRGVDVKVLPDTFGCPPEWKKAKNSEMVHTPGSARRLWNEASIYFAYPEWRVNNDKWESLGGTPYKGEFYNAYNCPVDFEAGAFVQHMRMLNIADYFTSGFAKKYHLIPDMSIWEGCVKFLKYAENFKIIEIFVKFANKTSCWVELKFVLKSSEQESPSYLKEQAENWGAEMSIEDNVVFLKVKALDEKVTSCVAEFLTA